MTQGAKKKPFHWLTTYTAPEHHHDQGVLNFEEVKLIESQWSFFRESSTLLLIASCCCFLYVCVDVFELYTSLLVLLGTWPYLTEHSSSETVLCPSCESRDRVLVFNIFPSYQSNSHDSAISLYPFLSPLLSRLLNSEATFLSKRNPLNQDTAGKQSTTRYTTLLYLLSHFLSIPSSFLLLIPIVDWIPWWFFFSLYRDSLSFACWFLFLYLWASILWRSDSPSFVVHWFSSFSPHVVIQSPSFFLLVPFFVMAVFPHFFQID